MQKESEKNNDYERSGTAAASTEFERAPMQKSWGDRFKRRAFVTATYAGLNGVFNLFISVAIAYVFERHFETNLNNYAQKMGAKLAAITGWSEKRLINTFYMGPKGIVLSGGTLLLPAIKWIEDHRSRLEFKIGHRFDQLQELLGKGNSASRQNLVDYTRITETSQNGNTLSLTAEETQRLHVKHHLDIVGGDRLAFKEHKLPWLKILGARAGALLTTTFGMSSLMGYMGLRDKFEQSGPAVTRGISKVFPWYSKILAEPDAFSKNLAGDVILTVSSAVTHKVVQDILHHSAAAQKQETPDMKHSIRIRKAEPVQKPDNFRSREHDKPAESLVMA